MADELWGPITLKGWRKTPHVSGRPATKDDVDEGRACFFIDNLEMTPHEMELPACALFTDAETGKREAVIVIQVESEKSDPILAGIRFMGGGNGVATLSELKILKGPSKRFKELAGF
jgi:hypothetical protein